MPSDPTPLLTAPDEPLLLPAPQGARPAPTTGWRRYVKWIVAGGLAALLLVLFTFGWFVHHRRSEAAEAANERRRNAIPMVTVVAAKRSANSSELLLPGSLTPITEASLYARASGYLKRRHVDIGDSVRRGQLLAEIDSPELDQQVAAGLANVAQARQQLNVARAAVGDARAKLDLARVTWQRYETLWQQDSVARQEVDQHRQEYASAQAALVSAEANVGAAVEAVRAGEANQRRLVALQQFEKLRAPFDGVITARNVDEGALIGGGGASAGDASMASTGANASTSSSTSGTSTSGGAGSNASTAGSSSGSGGTPNASPTELFRIAQIDRLRVYVSVPQESAAMVQVGSPAAIFLQEFSGGVEGRVTRTARALDASSRTLLTEVQIDNTEHALMPGAYAQVRLASARTDPPLLVPGEALIARAEGTSVASLQPLDEAERGKLADPSDARCARRIHLQRVVLGRDYGTEVEISQGLRGGEFLVLNPGDTVQENAVMLPQLQKPEEPPGQGGGAGQKPDDGGGDKKKDKDKDAEQDRQRAQAQSTCIEDQAAARRRSRPPGAEAASAPAPGGTASSPPNPATASAPGGPSDRSPAGIQSPSIAAPTQGRPKAGGGQGQSQGK